jgi:hypothetical protein
LSCKEKRKEKKKREKVKMLLLPIPSIWSLNKSRVVGKYLLKQAICSPAEKFFFSATEPKKTKQKSAECWLIRVDRSRWSSQQKSTRERAPRSVVLGPLCELYHTSHHFRFCLHCHWQKPLQFPKKQKTKLTMSNQPLSKNEVERIAPNDVHNVLKRTMLVDGFDVVRIYYLRVDKWPKKKTRGSCFCGPRTMAANMAGPNR